MFTIEQAMQVTGCTKEQAIHAIAHFTANPVTVEERTTLAAIDAEAEAPQCEMCEGPAVLVGEQWTCPDCCPISDEAESEPAAALPIFRIDYVHDADRERAQVRRQLADGAQTINAIIARIDGLMVELPTPQEPDDDADQAHLAIYDIIDNLYSLSTTIARAARRLS